MKRFYKIIFTLILFYGISYSAFGQALGIEWAKCFGGTDDDLAYSIFQTTDGGYVVSGYSRSNDGDVTGQLGEGDYWIVKLDSLGTLQWQKCLGGTNDDIAYSIIQTADNGYAISGYSSSYNGDVTGFHGGSDFWVVKLDSSGLLLWQKCFGGTLEEIGYYIIQTNDGGYAIAGDAESPNNGDVTGNHGVRDCWIVKTDSLGTLQWQKCLGGTSQDIAFSIMQTADSGFAISGCTFSNDGDVSGNHGIYDYWIMKIDNAGNLIWQKCFGGTNSEYAYSIIQTNDGGYAVAGYSLSVNGDVSNNHGINDYWIIKLDSNGSLQWQKCLGGTFSEFGHSIIQTTDDGYAIVGFTYSNNGDVTGYHGAEDYWLVKLDSAGAFQWQKCLGGSAKEEAYSVRQTMDGGYVVAGFAVSNDYDVSGNHGSRDYWIVKLGYDSITSVHNFQSTPFNFQLFPNPTTGTIQLTINKKNNAPLLCEIINVMGEKVYETTLSSPLRAPLTPKGESTRAELDVSFLAKGMYVVRVGDGERWENRKLLVE